MARQSSRRSFSDVASVESRAVRLQEAVEAGNPAMIDLRINLERRGGLAPPSADVAGRVSISIFSGEEYAKLRRYLGTIISDAKYKPEIAVAHNNRLMPLESFDVGLMNAAASALYTHVATSTESDVEHYEDGKRHKYARSLVPYYIILKATRFCKDNFKSMKHLTGDGGSYDDASNLLTKMAVKGGRMRTTIAPYAEEQAYLGVIVQPYVSITAFEMINQNPGVSRERRAFARSFSPSQAQSSAEPVYRHLYGDLASDVQIVRLNPGECDPLPKFSGPISVATPVENAVGKEPQEAKGQARFGF